MCILPVIVAKLDDANWIVCWVDIGAYLKPTRAWYVVGVFSYHGVGN